MTFMTSDEVIKTCIWRQMYIYMHMYTYREVCVYDIIKNRTAESVLEGELPSCSHKGPHNYKAAPLSPPEPWTQGLDQPCAPGCQCS